MDTQHGFRDDPQRVSRSDLVHALNPCCRPIGAELRLSKHKLERNTLGPAIVPRFSQANCFSRGARCKAGTNGYQGREREARIRSQSFICGPPGFRGFAGLQCLVGFC